MKKGKIVKMYNYSRGDYEKYFKQEIEGLKEMFDLNEEIRRINELRSMLKRIHREHEVT